LFVVSASGPIAHVVINGVTDASAFSGSDLTNVQISSSAGGASLLSSGSASIVTLNAATDASAMAAGTISVSTFTATASVGLVAGEIVATVIDAGEEASVFTLGNASLDSLTSGLDAVILAGGDIDTTSADIGGDLAAAAGGLIDGSYDIFGDLLALVAGGNIAGNYTVAHNVDHVLSHAGIHADFTVGFDPSDPTVPTTVTSGEEAGVLRFIRAWNNIAGDLTAASAIDQVIAGEDVTATRTAPSIGAVIENNRDGFDPLPDAFDGFEFDWLNALAADVAAADTLASDSIALSVTATGAALTAAANDLQREAAATTAALTLIGNLVAAQNTWQAARLTASATAANNSARREGDLTDYFVGRAIAEVTAIEIANAKLAVHDLKEVAHQLDGEHRIVKQSKTIAASEGELTYQVLAGLGTLAADVATLGGYATYQYNTGQLTHEEYGDRLLNGGLAIFGARTQTAGGIRGIKARFASSAPRKAVTGMDNRAYSSLAEQQYDAIRALFRSDIETVASNAGLSVAEVTAMKKHLFFGKHQRFAPEVGRVIRKRFDANDEIAEAWIRAQNGPLNARQKQWFRQLADHELAERTMMGQGVPFQDLSAWQRVNGQWEHVYREGLQGAHELAPRTPKFWPFFD
jgi:hypothetical protein